MINKIIRAALLLPLIGLGIRLKAQTIARFQPTHMEMVARYKRAAKIDGLTKKRSIQIHC